MTDPRWQIGPTILDRIKSLEARLAYLEAGPRSITHCFLSNSGAVSIPTAGIAVTFDTDDSDPDDMHGAGTAIITIPTDLGGWYHVEANGMFDASSGGTVRYIAITVNGVMVRPQRHETLGRHLTVSGMLSLADAAIVRMAAYQDSGGALDLLESHLQIYQIFRA